MASDLKIRIDTEALDEIVRLNCDNIKCRFNNLSQHTCSLKWINIGIGGKCANFEENRKEVTDAFHERLKQ